MDQGAITLVLHLSEAFERVSLPVVWAVRRRMRWLNMDHVGWRRGGSDEGRSAKKRGGSIHCLVEDWQDCEELKPKPKKFVFVDKTWKRRNTVRGGARPHADAVAWDAAEAPRG